MPLSNQDYKKAYDEVILSRSFTNCTPKESEWSNISPDEIIDKLNAIHAALQPKPVAYIVTNNRGERYLVFAGSVEHENAQMFGYEIKPLYE